MKANAFELTAELREDLGKGASRRLRRKNGMVPAVIYGGNEKATTISLDHNKVINALGHEAFYSHILTLDIAGQKTKAILKDLQRHQFKRAILHMDFLRVKGSDVITMKVPLHFLGQDVCPGVKAGGIVNHQFIDVEIRCKVDDLPEFINVDVSKLELDQAIHLYELVLPKGIEIHSGHSKDYNPPIVSVHLPRQMKLDDEETTAQAEATEAAAESDKDGETATQAGKGADSSAKAPAKGGDKPAEKK